MLEGTHPFIHASIHHTQYCGPQLRTSLGEAGPGSPRAHTAGGRRQKSSGSGGHAAGSCDPEAEPPKVRWEPARWPQRWRPPLPSSPISLLRLCLVGCTQLRFGGVGEDVGSLHLSPSSGTIAPHQVGCSDTGYTWGQRLHRRCCHGGSSLRTAPPPAFSLQTKPLKKNQTKANMFFPKHPPFWDGVGGKERP